MVLSYILPRSVRAQTLRRRELRQHATGVGGPPGEGFRSMEGVRRVIKTGGMLWRLIVVVGLYVLIGT